MLSARHPLPCRQIYMVLQQCSVGGCAHDNLPVTTLKIYAVANYLTMSGYMAEPHLQQWR